MQLSLKMCVGSVVCQCQQLYIETVNKRNAVRMVHFYWCNNINIDQRVQADIILAY